MITVATVAILTYGMVIWCSAEIKVPRLASVLGLCMVSVRVRIQSQVT